MKIIQNSSETQNMNINFNLQKWEFLYAILLMWDIENLRMNTCFVKKD